MNVGWWLYNEGGLAAVQRTPERMRCFETDTFAFQEEVSDRMDADMCGFYVSGEGENVKLLPKFDFITIFFFLLLFLLSNDSRTDALTCLTETRLAFILPMLEGTKSRKLV